MTNNGRNNGLILECFNSLGTAQSKGHIAIRAGLSLPIQLEK